MKKIILLTVALFFAAACRKAATRSVHDGIVGKWKVSEYLADPGDGSGTWQPVSPSNPVYLEFKSNGTLVASPFGVNNFDHYELTSNSTLVFLIGNQRAQRWYRLSDTLLTITGGCIEACGTKYIPVQ